MHTCYSPLDPSAAADRRIRRRKFVRRKSAGKITARRISRRILLAVNTSRRRIFGHFYRFSPLCVTYFYVCSPPTNLYCVVLKFFQ